ncbi:MULTISPECIES: DUF4383 domain-containing protein [Streptomyces]|uniref:DUF4383 domain-containing protein n=1 Tax=Streptomyces melanosporofaciens TaxID=67327 RepID=A0A1H4MJJ8_STRMJ|nr:DUF4383 domain-containing protein [Streptomyces melanosporofaciens]SEB82878.1 protein of unknown function [Streptomyces melanosporofaciens]
MAMGRPSPIGPHPAGTARHFPERIGAHTSLDEHLPVDHRLSKFYRVGAGLMGLVLVAFGILGLIDQVGFFDIGGDTVAGLNTNGALSVLSIVIGLLLFVGMVIGGNFASTLNMVLGILFLLSGFINLAVLETTFNFLAFRMQNVLFSFVVGLLLMWFGMYGRVSGGLPHDNPYWVTRHPEQAEREAVHARDLIAARGRAAEQTGTTAPPGTPLTPGAPGGPVTAGAGAEGGRESAERRGASGERHESAERRGAAEESGERRGQPPGKWGKLDQPGGAEPTAKPDKPGSRRWTRFLRRPRSR